MKGWNTKHQEFTPARGDPLTIHQLINQFHLDEIISFDQTNSIIRTTIEHNRYIRLSDLITLNIKKQVIAFRLPQYLQVIIQLLELLKKMKQKQTQHGNLKMKNILLDLIQSKNQLDNNLQEITFEVILINFAQFDNSQMENDFDMVYAIYLQIAEYFPKRKKELQIEKNKVILKEQLSLDFLKILKEAFSDKQYNKTKKYTWDSNQLAKFFKNYKINIVFSTKCEQFYDLIQQQHQYYLIVNHFSKFNSQKFLYQTEPKDFDKACEKINLMFNFNQDLLNLKNQMEDEFFLKKYNKHINLYLKQYGYFQNILEFVRIAQEINNVVQFQKPLIDSIGQQNTSRKLMNQFLTPYQQSSMILIKMVKNKINAFKVNSNCKYSEIANYSIQMRNSLIQQLFKIQQIGMNYSRLLIEHCINVNLGYQIKSMNLQNTDNMIKLMVESWLKWIDQYIFDEQLSEFGQLINKINKETFQKYIEEQGFQLLRVLMEKQIKTIVDTIFYKLQR